MGEISLGDVLDESDLREVRPREWAPRRRRGPGLRELLRPEPMFWGLFSAGGFVTAFLVPIHVAILGISFGAGWLPRKALAYDRILDLVRHPITKLYLEALVALPLFHWAHRFRFVVHHQLGIHGLKRLIRLACYGTAVTGAALAALILLRI